MACFLFVLAAIWIPIMKGAQKLRPRPNFRHNWLAGWNNRWVGGWGQLDDVIYWLPGTSGNHEVDSHVTPLEDDSGWGKKAYEILYSVCKQHSNLSRSVNISVSLLARCGTQFASFGGTTATAARTAAAAGAVASSHYDGIDAYQSCYQQAAACLHHYVIYKDGPGISSPTTVTRTVDPTAGF